MALVGAPFPYDIETLLAGGAGIYYAPISVAVPVDGDDIILAEAPYTPVTGWVPLGATKEAFSYSHGSESAGLEIQETSSVILEEITAINRSITVSQAAFNPFGFQLMENATTVTSIANAGTPTRKKVSFGSYTSKTRYRFAFISRRPLGAGIVEESTGKERGRFVIGCAYQAQLAAEDITMEQGKGELTAVALTFTLFPETTDPQPENEDVGFWDLEDVGVFT